MTERRGDDRRGARGPYAEERGTSWISVILGLLTALGAGLILSGIVGGIVGAILGTGGRANRPPRVVPWASWGFSSPCSAGVPDRGLRRW